MRRPRAILKIELCGEEADDGRILIKSPDLEGFYFMVNPDEDPWTAMKPTLLEFMRLYLKAEVGEVECAQTPRQYRRQMLGVISRPSRDYSVFAEVAAAAA